MGKSKAKAPTRAQKVFMNKAGVVVRNWLVLCENETQIKLVNRLSGKSRTIKK